MSGGIAGEEGPPAFEIDVLAQCLARERVGSIAFAGGDCQAFSKALSSIHLALIFGAGSHVLSYGLCGAAVLFLILYFVFALHERKNEIQNKMGHTTRK